MQFNQNFYNTMDRGYYIPLDATQPTLEEPIEIDEKKDKPKTKLGPNELGGTTNPMENTLNSLQMKIREGVGRVEFEFIGQGKTNSQQPGPESFGARERQENKNGKILEMFGLFLL
ncbi:MAG: hypothetical protein QXG00_06005 [Candidatus Woesearchaeota archaeon]